MRGSLLDAATSFLLLAFLVNGGLSIACAMAGRMRLAWFFVAQLPVYGAAIVLLLAVRL